LRPVQRQNLRGAHSCGECDAHNPMQHWIRVRIEGSQEPLFFVFRQAAIAAWSWNWPTDAHHRIHNQANTPLLDGDDKQVAEQGQF